MGALPTSQPAGIRYAAYIQELHEFLATSGTPYGSPSDLPLVVANLQRPGTFADDLSSLIRSFILRQGGSMPHAELLEILSLAVGGPELALHPQQHGDSLRQLLSFISGVQRRPWNVPPNVPGEVVPFPADLPTPASGSNPPSVATADAILQPAPAAPRTAGRRRTGFWAALAAVAALAVVGVLFARMHSSSESGTEIFHVEPVPLASLQQNSVPRGGETPRNSEAPGAPVAAIGPAAADQSPLASAHPRKPTADGEALIPQGSRHVPSQPNWIHTQPAQGTSPAGRGTVSQPPQTEATNSIPATVFAPYHPPDGPTQPAAPIVRQPAYRNPDNYIAGEMPTGGAAQPTPSYFTVFSGVMAANLISAPDPEYPLLARLAHVQGQVTLLAVVAKDGTVEATRILRGNHLLRSAAEDAVRHFRYRPYRIDGSAVDVATVVTVTFHDPADPPQQ